MRILKIGIIFIVSILCFIIMTLYLFQEKLIFRPTKLTIDYTYTFSQPFDELFIEAKDGALLNAIHFKAEKPKGIILYFHGNAGDLSRWGEITSFFTKLEYDVLIMDYRTYGKSTGQLSEENLFNDAQLFYNYALKLFSEDNIIVYGRSIGSTFAGFVASANNPRKLILEAPFYNLEDIVAKRIPVFPIKYLLNYQFPTDKLITSVKCPIIIFHGTKDGVVPFYSGEKLSKIRTKNKVIFIPIPGGGHNDLSDFDIYNERLWAELK